MSLFAFPRFVQNEFGGMFRLMDELAAASRQSGYSQSPRFFAPKFSYRENKDNFELQGELPGVESKDVEIEWTDASTLSIRGRTESHTERGTRPSASAIEAQPEQEKIADSETSSYHKASVEDESDTTMSGANPDAAATPAETPAESTVATTETQEVAQAPQEDPSYYFSERSIGQFARTFNFPSRVDTENVKASLKNGILSIVVPKLQAPATRRVNIE